MGKSSSSTKSKRSKYSSPVPTRKRIKTIRERKRIKTRRGRSKKVKHNDDSSSLLSVSSSSEDSYRSRKSRSHILKDVKGAKRRARSCSSSSEESSRFRKRKQSRRKNDSEVKKKTNRHKKKNAQRDASISSRSSGSWSCSTCQSSDEGEYESRRGRSERTGNNLRKLKNVKRRNKKERYRSRSCSSCSRCSSSDYWSEEKLIDGNMPKQLRSVIIFTKNDEEGKELDWNEHKEEMIYEYDGYPSSRSDTNDMENRRVSGHQSHDVSEKKRSIENEKREDACVFNIKTTELSDICKDVHDCYVESKPACGGFETKDVVEEKINEIANATGNVNSDDLELLLRQKALENLRRFRGGIQINARSTTKQKDESKGASNPPSPKRADLSQNECAKDAGARGVWGDFVHSVQEEEKILDGKTGSNISVSFKNNAYQPNQVAVAGRGKVNTTFGHGITKQRLVSSAVKQALSNATTPAMEAPASQVSNKVKLLTGSSVGEHDAASFSGNGNSDEVNNASHSASAKSSSCLKRADLSQNECAKDAGARGVWGDFVHSVQEEEKILDGKTGSNISVSFKNNAYQPNQVAVAGRGKVNTTFGHGITKQRLVSSALKQALSNATTPAMEAPASQVSNKVKLLTGSSVGEHDAASFSGNGNSDEVNNASHFASAKSSSSLASAGRDVGSNKLQDEDKDGSHLEQKTVTCPKSLSCGGNGDTVNNDCGFNTAEPSSRVTSAARDLKGQDDGEGSQLEEKTMSVMRGGEMVQVSYKVYIPKKAPALARRQLKR